jgi:hypothetical protein
MKCFSRKMDFWLALFNKVGLVFVQWVDDLISSHLISSHLISSHLISSHLISSIKVRKDIKRFRGNLLPVLNFSGWNGGTHDISDLNGRNNINYNHDN